MRYISTYTNNETVFVWERDQNNERTVRTYSAPWYFYTKDPNGKYKDIYGKSLTKHTFKRKRDFYNAKTLCKSNAITMYESDIAPELKILSEHYYNSTIPKLHISFYDIENDYDPSIGFASVNNAYAPINAITICHAWTKKFITLVVPPTDKLWEQGVESLSKKTQEISEIHYYKNERDLLLAFLHEIENSDMLVGYNSDYFDLPYIGKRIQNTLSEKYFKKLSFPEGKFPSYREINAMGQTITTLDLSGRMGGDFLQLFRKYEQSPRPSYKLSAIADEFLPDLPKLEYSGSLYNIYHQNFELFVRYNIRDVEILLGLEEKVGYVDLANQMYHLSTGTFNQVLGTIKLAEHAIINYCHHELDVIVPDSKGVDYANDKQIQGAHVLDTKTGQYDWVASVDVTSLYPSSIITVNISPEKVIGQFASETKAYDEIIANTDTELTLVYENQTTESDTARNWQTKLQNSDWTLSGFGTVFKQDNLGIIPSVLDTWFQSRKIYKGKKLKWEQTAKDIAKKYQ